MMRSPIDRIQIALDVTAALLAEGAAQEQAAVVNAADLSPLEELGRLVLRAAEAEQAGASLAQALHDRAWTENREQLVQEQRERWLARHGQRAEEHPYAY